MRDPQRTHTEVVLLLLATILTTVFAAAPVRAAAPATTTRAPAATAPRPLPPIDPGATVSPLRVPGPDLVIHDVRGVPDAITSTEPFAHGEGRHGSLICPITVTVKNVGNQDAWFPAGCWIVAGPSHYTNLSGCGVTNQKTTTNTAIRPGETWSTNLAAKITCFRGDPLDVVLEVDPDHRVQERNEGNNRWSKPLANRAVVGAGAPPDLVIDSVTFRPPHPTTYDRVMITVHMRNAGAGPAIFCQSESNWSAGIEGWPGHGGSVGGAGERVIPAGQTFVGGVYIVEPNTMPTGCYRVVAMVDPNGKVAESDDANNQRTAYLSMNGASCDALIRADRRRLPLVEAARPPVSREAVPRSR